MAQLSPQLSPSFGTALGQLQLVPLLASAAGIAIALLAFWLVRRAAPHELGRAVVAAALILSLPVAIYMSAMLSEEMLAALLTSLVLLGGIRAARPEAGATRRDLLEAAGLGVIAGLVAQFVRADSVVTTTQAGLSLVDCARIGVWIHGRVADRWAEEHGSAGMLASDLIEGCAWKHGGRREPDRLDIRTGIT